MNSTIFRTLHLGVAPMMRKKEGCVDARTIHSSTALQNVLFQHEQERLSRYLKPTDTTPSPSLCVKKNDVDDCSVTNSCYETEESEEAKKKEYENVGPFYENVTVAVKTTFEFNYTRKQDVETYTNHIYTRILDCRKECIAIREEPASVCTDGCAFDNKFSMRFGQQLASNKCGTVGREWKVTFRLSEHDAFARPFNHANGDWLDNSSEPGDTDPDAPARYYIKSTTVSRTRLLHIHISQHPLDSSCFTTYFVTSRDM